MRTRDLFMYKDVIAKPWNKGKAKEILKNLCIVRKHFKDDRLGFITNLFDGKETYLDQAFIFFDTPQGFGYWSNISYGPIQ